MAQRTFVDGEVLTATLVNTYLMGEGGAWTSWTPQIDQGASTNIAKTVTYSKYSRYGRTIHWSFYLALTASGTAGSGVYLTLPVTASATEATAGAGLFFDSSTSTQYGGAWVGTTTTQVLFAGDWAGTGAWGTAPNLAIASGDVLRGQITYEAAS
jgi:hypothetical protein